jgi:methylthioribose-1-phosphate isomerase
MHPPILLPNNATMPAANCCAAFSRPTAVNLSIAATALKGLAEREARAAGATTTSVTGAVVGACEAMLADDVAANKVGAMLR